MHVSTNHINGWVIDSEGGNNFIVVGGTPQLVVSKNFYPTGKVLDGTSGNNIPALNANIIFPYSILYNVN